MACSKCEKCQRCQKSTHRTDEEKKRLTKRLNAKFWKKNLTKNKKCSIILNVKYKGG